MVSSRRADVTSTATPDLADPVGRGCAEDRGWFEDEVAGVLPELYGTALRLARNRADAEDLVAEALKNAWAHLSTLRDRSSFRGWICRILTNTFLSELRRRGSRPETEPLLDEVDNFSLFERLHQPFLLWWSNPEQEFLNSLLREDLERSIQALPDAFRVVVILVDLQGCSYQESAETLGVPIGTVRSRLARGRSLLQEALWEHAQEAGIVPRAANPAPPDNPGSA